MNSTKLLKRAAFRFKDIHMCLAVVIMCLDFRFREETIALIEEIFGLNVFDLAGLPGSSRAFIKGSKIASSCITVPKELHHIKKFFVVHHQDCGAYGGSARFNFDSDAEQAFHEEKLRETRSKILEIYPESEVILIYAKLTAENKFIDFLLVD